MNGASWEYLYANCYIHIYIYTYMHIYIYIWVNYSDLTATSGFLHRHPKIGIMSIKS